ncbi:MAG: TonB family protein [Nitrospiraceae bacterium]
MTLSQNGQYRVQGWVVSASFHVLALTGILGLMAQVKPAMPKEVFKWDVALVEPQQSQETRQAEIKPAQEAAQPTPRPAAAAPNRPQPVTKEVQIPKVTTVVPREIPQVVETIEPIQQVVAVQTRTEPAEVPEPNEPVVEPIATLVQPEAATAESATTTTAATVAVQDATQTEPMAPESVPQVAMATRSTPAVKVDHGWLAESLRRRLAEVKRYPSAARLNGWEGRVVLRAVIRADGHLSEVKVHRSSGHESLDNAAMETIRLACPLHLQQPISTSELAIYVPIVYSLAS